MRMQNIDHTLIWDCYDLSFLTHFHFQIIQNNIMDFIGNFWCNDLIWTTWTWYGFCARTTIIKFDKPLLNYSIRLSKVRIIFIELDLGFWYRFSTQKVVFNQYTKFTFFHLWKHLEIGCYANHISFWRKNRTLLKQPGHQDRQGKIRTCHQIMTSNYRIFMKVRSIYGVF